MMGAGGVVLVLVLLLLLFGLRRRRGAQNATLSERQSRNLVLAGGVVVPVLVMLSLVVGSVTVGKEVVSPPGHADVQIEVVGQRWWWEVNYLDEQGRRIMTTANEIHVPVGKKVRFLLRSDNVIHSFWVPRLQGKIDMIPGQTNTVSFVAEQAGVYRGQCAEFCGIQHAKMGFLVIAEAEDAYLRWLDNQRERARRPDTRELRRGRVAFVTAACIACHTVRGLTESGKLGPDLTHVGSRRTLAAASIPNTRGHMAGWIAGPQHIKPGNLMPANPIKPQDLQALVSYLQSLE